MESKANCKAEEYNRLVIEHNELRKGSSKMIRTIESLKATNTKQDKALNLTQAKVIECESKIRSNEVLIKELKVKENNLLKEKMKQKATNDQLADLNVELVESNNKLTNDLIIVPELKGRIKVLENEINDLKGQKKLVESNLKTFNEEETKEIKQLKLIVEKTLSDYLDVRCKQNNVDQETVKGLLPVNYTTEDIDKVVNTLSDRSRRLNKVPFMIQPKTVTLNESLGLNEEDKQTISFLRSSLKK